MNNVCGLCGHFWRIGETNTRYFFTQATSENYSAIFRLCVEGLVHESFIGCMLFQPTKTFYCARFETMVSTEVCLRKQLQEVDESCINCLQGEIVIDVMRGVEWSELK